MLQVKRSNRTFTLAPANLGPRLMVDTCTWDAAGGPSEATLTALGSAADLWELTNWLGCPVELIDELGEVRWWGFIFEIQVALGNVSYGLSLATMTNRAAVAYTSKSSKQQTRKTTAWAQDQTSVDTYGQKEVVLSAGTNLSDAAAATLRDSVIAQTKLPQAEIRVQTSGTPRTATVTCHGWYDVLSWKYFTRSAADGSKEQTTDQITYLIATAGMGQAFIPSVRILSASGVSTNAAQTGDNTAQAVVQALLDAGTGTNGRMLATVNRFRELEVTAEPADTDTSTLWLDADGHLATQNGQPWLPQASPVGVWCKLRTRLPGGVATDIYPSFFIQKATWTAAGNTLAVESRGVPQPQDLVKAKQG
jgi:hypothetical protein